MSRRAAIVDDFDDDTDLPLPAHPLPNTGARGPLLEELHISDDELDPPARAGPASAPRPAPAAPAPRPGAPPTVTDITPYKAWSCIYPIYLDAKRAYGTGARRVPRPKALWWPLSKDIADATNRLGLGTLHEVNKAHPRDWDNPGRVRVQWKRDGRPVNPAITTKKQLLEMIALMIQRLKPENAPRPPFLAPARPTSPAAKAPAAARGKHPAKAPAPPAAPAGRRLPLPPAPLPPLASRVSPYSPALVSGVLVETVKAGMNAQEAGAAPGAIAGAPGAPGGAQKGKRKVVRVRG